MLPKGQLKPSLQQLREIIVAKDHAVLQGRIIILDPGHGGKFSGAVSKSGLKESGLNLNVALRLESLLEKAGATVIMTRYTNTEVVSGKRKTLSRDLAERCRIATNYNADLFLSVHHNASAVKAQYYNATETYYQLSHADASFEAAQSIHQALSFHLGIKHNNLMQGNYHVLRNITIPGVLGEAYYLTNKEMEKKLKGDEYIDTEAASYFLGILQYFAKGIPRIIALDPNNVTIISGQPNISALVEDEEWGSGIDPHAIEMYLDNKKVDAQFSTHDGIVNYVPDEVLANGTHTVALTIKNLEGNSSQIRYCSFTINRPPYNTHMDNTPKKLSVSGSSMIMVEALFVDEFGLPVIDGTRIEFRATSPLQFGYDFTVHGVARTYVVTKSHTPVTVYARYDSLIIQHVISAEPDSNSRITGMIRNKSTKKRLERVSLFVNEKPVTYTNKDGYYSFSTSDAGQMAVTFAKQGFVPSKKEITIEPKKAYTMPAYLKPVYKGLLHNKSIVIDPELPYTDSDATSLINRKTADINLRVAKYCAEYLQHAGAQVLLTRTDEKYSSPAERLNFAHNNKAKVYLVIRHDKSKKSSLNYAYASHHYQSSRGPQLSRLILNEIHKQFKYKMLPPRSDYSYLVLHSGDPVIVIVNSSLITYEKGGESVHTNAHSRKEAYAIYNGIVRYYTGNRYNAYSYRGIVVDNNRKKISNALVTLDQYVTIQTDNSGKYYFRNLERGKHNIHIEYGAETIKEFTFSTLK